MTPTQLEVLLPLPQASLHQKLFFKRVQCDEPVDVHNLGLTRSMSSTYGLSLPCNSVFVIDSKEGMHQEHVARTLQVHPCGFLLQRENQDILLAVPWILEALQGLSHLFRVALK